MAGQQTGSGSDTNIVSYTDNYYYDLIICIVTVTSMYYITKKVFIAKAFLSLVFVEWNTNLLTSLDSAALYPNTQNKAKSSSYSNLLFQMCIYIYFLIY